VPKNACALADEMEEMWTRAERRGPRPHRRGALTNGELIEAAKAQPQRFSSGLIEVFPDAASIKGTLLETGSAALVAARCRPATRRGSWRSCASRSASPTCSAHRSRPARRSGTWSRAQPRTPRPEWPRRARSPSPRSRWFSGIFSVFMPIFSGGPSVVRSCRLRDGPLQQCPSGPTTLCRRCRVQTARATCLSRTRRCRSCPGRCPLRCHTSRCRWHRGT
jgi:hypothetical protein